MICKFYKLLNNPLRVDLLVRVHKSRDGFNVSLLADEMQKSGLCLSGVSQYLKQLEDFGVIKRMREGRYVNYVGDVRNADPRVRAAVELIVANESKRMEFRGVYAAMMNPFRARAIALVAESDEMTGEELCEKTNHQLKYLKRDLKEAVDTGLIVADDSDPYAAVYRYQAPDNPIARRLVELCF